MIAPGTLLGGRYRIERLLGQGGMGAVFEGTQEGLGRRVAVKLLDPQLAADPSQLERFRREGEVVAALGHPNIVQVTDFQFSDQGPFLVMELLRGQSLGGLLDAERTLPPNRVAFIAAQVLSALGAAHRAGVVHRDIKPDNVFILSEAAVPDSVKVLDFGIAKLVADGQNAKLTGTGAMLGTPSFMAPEQARGAMDVDARADLYAVGATMYQALTGRLPHEAASVPALLFAIVEKEPTPLREVRPDLPPELVAVVERAMAKDRAARFQSADEMRSALSPWSGLPVSGSAAVSSTAATVAGTLPSPVAPAPATPVVRAGTPAVSGVAATLPSVPQTPERRGPGALVIVMGSIVALALVVGVVFLGIFYMKNKRDEEIAREERRAAAAEEKREEKRAERAAAPSSSEPAPSAAAKTTTVVATTSARPTAGASASATVSTSPSPSATAAPVTPGQRRYSGAKGYWSGSDFSNCPSCDWEAYRAAVRQREPEISACFKASELDPPLHENPEYEIGVTAAGALHSFKAVSDGTPKLDRCIRDILFRITMHKPSGGAGSFKISFRAECVSGWPGQCK
ncbi:MAG TPA: serine/threonine-protein kinase [Polyangiaceae bacterium]|nr:serine/threonine-protein kinase [Polyangiaceae bacterium]